MPLETDRLLFTEWKPEDWLTFRPIATDPDVMKYINNGESWPDEQIKEFVNRQIDNSTQYGFCLWKLLKKPTEKLIGFCGLQPLFESGEIEIGWWLAKSSWGQGLATEAAMKVVEYGFGKIGLERIVAIAQPQNTASIRVMEKLGMRYVKDTVGRYGVPVVQYALESPNGLRPTAA